MSARETLPFVLAMNFVLQAAPAAGQEGSEPGASPAVLEEVTVTARKRQESLLEVPVIAAVMTQESLERTKTDNLYTLASQVPGLQLGNAVNSTGTQATLRGIGTSVLNATMDQSVSLNVDGQTLSQGVAYGLGMFDIARVEVLKGPQSLFFGKNNTAGVISLTSADPTDEVQIIARAGYEVEAEEKQVEFVLSGPVADSLKLRLAARYSDLEGFFKNKAVAVPGGGGVTPDEQYAPTETLMLRGTALFEPNDVFSARLKIAYQDYRMDGGASPLDIALCPDGLGPVPPANISLHNAAENCKADDTLRLPWADQAAFAAALPNGGRMFEDSTQLLPSLELSFDLTEHLNLTSLTGYYDMSFETAHNGTTVSAYAVFVNNIFFDNTQFTQELRLTSDFADSPLNFTLGAFYLSGDQSNRVRIPINRAFSANPILIHVLHEIDIEAKSFFGQATWDISEQWELAAGARWTDEERNHAQTNFNSPNGAVGPAPTRVPRISSSNVSPEVSLTFKPTQNLTAFAAYKTGFKSGSFTSQTFVPATGDASFRDEEASGGELGIKTRSADGRFAASIGAYYYDYEDLQVGGLELTPTPQGGFVFAVRTLNAAAANVRGVDLDLSYLPAAINGLSLNAAVAYNRARYDSFPNAPCGNGQTIAQGCNQFLNPATQRYSAQDLSGRRLVRAPDVSAYVGFNQNLVLANGMTLDFGAGTTYTSKYSTVLVDLPGFEQESFFKVDANIALKSADEAWEFGLIGRNLGNELTRNWCVNSNVQNGTIFGGQISGAAQPGPAGDDEAVCMIERGRQIWGRVVYRF